MEDQAFDSQKFYKVACFFEGSLLIIAFLLGWIMDIDPFLSLFFSEKAVMEGVLATLPLLIVFFAMQQLPYAPIRKIRNLLQDSLGASLSGRHWADLFILAGIAGFSEEVLFRGFLQPWLESVWGGPVGLLVSNLIFAMVHAVTPLYALLALLMGLYMGFFLDYDGERKLLSPIVIHTLYDFVAFLVILRNYRNNL